MPPWWYTLAVNAPQPPPRRCMCCCLFWHHSRPFLVPPTSPPALRFLRLVWGLTGGDLWVGWAGAPRTAIISFDFLISSSRTLSRRAAVALLSPPPLPQQPFSWAMSLAITHAPCRLSHSAPRHQGATCGRWDGDTDAPPPRLGSFLPLTVGQECARPPPLIAVHGSRLQRRF